MNVSHGGILMSASTTGTISPERLADGLDGRVITPADADYDAVRTVVAGASTVAPRPSSGSPARATWPEPLHMPSPAIFSVPVDTAYMVTATDRDRRRGELTS